MAQFVVRNLEDDVRDKLRELARRRGQCMEEAVRDILRNAVVERGGSPARLGTRIAARFADCPLAQDIPELRGQTIEPPRFEP